MQRPSYLTNVPDLSERAVQGIGSALPPHISIRGNQFTLVDGAGNRKPVGPSLDFLVVDIAEHTGKMFYKNPNWTPDSDDPPDCWSMNGVGPSRDAINPQARTCAECPQNVRGSRISNLGSAIKACRDEVVAAVVTPAYPSLVFQMKITPGSFKNWRKFNEECKSLGQQTGAAESVGTILTRATFEPDVNGVLVFKALSYPDEALWNVRTAALAAKATDILVGRMDRPRELPAPAAQQQLPAPNTAPRDEASAGFAPAQQTPAAQQAAINPAFGQGAGQTVTQAAPQSAPEGAKKRGRPRNQPAEQTAAQTQPAMAPFRPEAAPAANGGAPFGIATSPQNPSNDIAAALDATFGKPAAGGGFGG